MNFMFKYTDGNFLCLGGKMLYSEYHLGKKMMCVIKFNIYKCWVLSICVKDL